MSEISKNELRDHRQKIVMGNVVDLYGRYEQEGLNLDAFAAITAVTRRTLWRYRTKGAFPSFQFLRAAAAFFHIHIIELLCSKEELRDMLSGLVSPDDVRTPTTADQVLVFDIEYERVLSDNLRRKRQYECLYPKGLTRLSGGYICPMSQYRYEKQSDTYPLWNIFPTASVLKTSPLELLTPKERRREIYGWLAEKYLSDVNSTSV